MDLGGYTKVEAGLIPIGSIKDDHLDMVLTLSSPISGFPGFPTIVHLSKALWVHRVTIGPQKGQFRPKTDLIGPLGPSVGT